MSIVTPSPDTPLLGETGPKDERSIDPVSRPARIVPAGRADSRAPAPTPGSAPERAADRALASDARFVLRLARATAEVGGAWSDASFERAVEAVRGHLAPAASRHVLAGSFDREAFRRVAHVAAGEQAFRRGADMAAGEQAESPWAVRLAYAIRWLELGDGAPRPPWATFRRSRAAQLRPLDRRRRPPGSRRRRG